MRTNETTSGAEVMGDWSLQSLLAAAQAGNRAARRVAWDRVTEGMDLCYGDSRSGRIFRMVAGTEIVSKLSETIALATGILNKLHD